MLASGLLCTLCFTMLLIYVACVLCLLTRALLCVRRHVTVIVVSINSGSPSVTIKDLLNCWTRVQCIGNNRGPRVVVSSIYCSIGATTFDSQQLLLLYCHPSQLKANPSRFMRQSEPLCNHYQPPYSNAACLASGRLSLFT